MSEAELIAATIEAARDPNRRTLVMAALRGPARRRPGTIREAAEILGCCTKTVERYAADGKLDPIRISARRIRYDLNQVDRLATEGASA